MLLLRTASMTFFLYPFVSFASSLSHSPLSTTEFWNTRSYLFLGICFKTHAPQGLNIACVVDKGGDRHER